MTSRKNVLRIATLSLATALFAAGPAFAQMGQSPVQSPTENQQNQNPQWHENQDMNLQLMSTDARLDKKLDTSTLMQGQLITAKLTTSVHTAAGVELPKGTELMGTVTRLHQGMNGGMTRVSLTFNQARLNNGRTVPVKATLLGALPPNNGYYSAQGESFPTNSRRISSQEKIDQEPGIISHVALHAAVQSNVSGTFISKKDKIDLPAGTQLQVAVAAENAPVWHGMNDQMNRNGAMNQSNSGMSEQ